MIGGLKRFWPCLSIDIAGSKMGYFCKFFIKIIGAIIYNLSAKWVGGIIIDLEE